MRRALRFTFFLALVCSFVSLAVCQTPQPTPDLNNPDSLLAAAAHINGLDNEGGAAWHLKAEYSIFDEQGNAAGTGAFEEWHADGQHWKRTYTSERFTQTEFVMPEGHFYASKAGAAPWPESLIADRFVHPMPRPLDTQDSVPDQSKQTFGPLTLNCIMFSQPENHDSWPVGLFPTYCFGPNDTILRAVLFNGTVEAVYNQVVTFEGRSVAKEIALTDEGKQLLHVWTTTLEPLSPGNPNLSISLVGAVKAEDKPVRVQPELFKDHMLRSKQNLPEGFVTLIAEIGTDGRARKLRVKRSTDTTLSIAAIKAAGNRTFQRYKEKGAPVETEGVISFAFTLRN